MKLSKTIDYVDQDTIISKELNKGKNCFVVYLDYYTEDRYVRLFARAFDFEHAREAFDLYDALKCEITHQTKSAIHGCDRFFRNNTNEVLA